MFFIVLLFSHRKDNKRKGGVNMGNKILPLRGLIYSKFKSEAEFARKIGWKRQRLNKITNGNRPPTLEEVEKIAEGLGKETLSIAKIFLENKSPKRQQNNKKEVS